LLARAGFVAFCASILISPKTNFLLLRVLFRVLEDLLREPLELFSHTRTSENKLREREEEEKETPRGAL